jgi:hypothetical protein
LARIAARLGISDATSRWRRQADLMRTRIIAGCWNAQRNSFVGTFGGTDLDATTLLLAEVGLV